MEMFTIKEKPAVLYLKTQIFDKLQLKYSSSRPDVFFKKGVLRNFARFIGKHLCQSLFFNNVVDLKKGVRLATLLKKRLWHRCFPVNFAKFLYISFTEHAKATASVSRYHQYFCW